MASATNTKPSTKRALLDLLASNPQKFISGEDAALQLGVSRTAIWKAVDSLRKDGCDIEAVTNKGYRLKQAADILSTEGVLQQLPSWLGGSRPSALGCDASSHAGVYDTLAHARAHSASAHARAHSASACTRTHSAPTRALPHATPTHTGADGTLEYTCDTSGYTHNAPRRAHDAPTCKGACVPTNLQTYKTSLLPVQVELHPSVTSTLDVARNRAHEGAPEGLVILAEEQTAGRGRRGRAFYSPKGSSVYLTILLRPHNATAEEVAPVTAMAAVAVSRAIEDVAPVCARVKWVNDVFVEGKKVCGILTEGAFDLESNSMAHLAVGIGVDVYAPRTDVPVEFADVIGHILEAPQKDMRNTLAARIIEHFFEIYAASPLGTHLQGKESQEAASQDKDPNGGPSRDGCIDKETPDYVREYRERCFVIGKPVLVQKGNEPARAATALDVDDNCHLLIEYADGAQELLSYGEISVAVQELHLE